MASHLDDSATLSEPGNKAASIAPYICRERFKRREIAENSMLAAISLAGLTLGATLALLASRFPTQVDKLEAGAGVLLICGLALLGSSLPTMP